MKLTRPKDSKIQQPIQYYGKKRYEINPLLARKKKPEIKLPDYRKEEYTGRR